MLESLHALTGAVIAYKIGSPLISLPLSFLSHFAIDLLPHWNPDIYIQKKKTGRLSPATVLFIFFDCLIGLFFGSYFAFKTLPNAGQAIIVLTGSFLAILPDLIEVPFFFFNINNKYIDKLLIYQNTHQWKASFWPGIFFQILYVALLLAWVL